MRIVLDMIGAQSSGSRNRGIGRYTSSLARAIAKNSRSHKIILVLNRHFLDSVLDIRETFRDLIPKKNIHIYNILNNVEEINPDNFWRVRAAELIREYNIQSLKPDVVLLSSLFEGFGDNAVTSVGRLTDGTKTAAVLYDLIPYLNKETYLVDDRIRKWYFSKLESLQRAGLLLSISEHSRKEAIENLAISGERVVNISSAADSLFKPTRYHEDQANSIRAKYNLHKPYIMYTGGIDKRKNIEGLIIAYSKLPAELLDNHQLVVVCSASDGDKSRLNKLARGKGLSNGQVILTGYVDEDDLLALYSLAKLFVFPSLHEGFGLPALEAMSCGTPTIGSNRTSIPEVIGRDDALFDPFQISSISKAITKALTDDNYRNLLSTHGLQQAKKFSWDKSACNALNALEELYRSLYPKGKTCMIVKDVKPALAYLSPLPPERSGIATYSAELLPELARYYDITLISDKKKVSDPWVAGNLPLRSIPWFEDNASKFERILYHFGNNSLHSHMFGLLKRFPGTVVLHDFYLSMVLDWMEIVNIEPGVFQHALYNSHGYGALVDYHQISKDDVATKWPANRLVLEEANGIIVHSKHAMKLGIQFYGQDFVYGWQIIPLLRKVETNITREQSRKALGINQRDFIVCSFGYLSPYKLSDRLLQAWLKSDLFNDNNCKLIFVGQNHGGSYGQSLLEAIKKNKASKKIFFTGFVSDAEFKYWLAAADFAVQLRTSSRGETSGAVLDCLAWGLPLILNDHGFAAEISEEVVIKLPDTFSDAELTAALEKLYCDYSLRKCLGIIAKEYILNNHHPNKVGLKYCEAIEEFNANGPEKQYRKLIEAIASINAKNPIDDKDLYSIARIIDSQIKAGKSVPTIYVDITAISRNDLRTGVQRAVRAVLHVLLNQPPQGYRIEPVHEKDGIYYHAYNYTARLLGIESAIFQESEVIFQRDDYFFGLDCVPDRVSDNKSFF
jgi:glycosyltransferase involved in cell wall biosynthesis